MLRHDGAGPLTRRESSGIELGAGVWESKPGSDPFNFVHYTRPGTSIVLHVGGDGGIRTHGPLTGSTVFKTVPLSQLRHVSNTNIIS